jgi:hypothetical protein
MLLVMLLLWMLIILERQNFARSAAGVRSNAACLRGIQKNIEILACEQFSPSHSCLVLGGTAALHALRVWGAVLFSAPSLESSLSWHLRRRYT